MMKSVIWAALWTRACAIWRTEPNERDASPQI